jgi:hypothetical protein
MTALRREAFRLLRQHRRQVVARIGGYPAPIPACDAQFNHLLEQRRLIGREIRRLNDLAAAAVAEQLAFIEASPCLSEPEKQLLRRC